MSYLVLARKYRPQTFHEVVGQEHVTRTISNAISSDRMAHALLFSGPRGTGKTTVARIVAKAMNCENGPTSKPCNTCRLCREITLSGSADVFEIDGASNNSVDQIRELRENIKFMPAYGMYKIYIIDEVHMLSTAAFNALLKTLEEPPAHVMFIFATTEPNKIPVTIHSRCQRYDFRRIGVRAITEHMFRLCSLEKIEIAESVLTRIAHESGGSMRDALSLLDQVMTVVNGGMNQERVLDVLGIADRKEVADVAEALLNGDTADALHRLDHVFKKGHDLKKFYQDLVTQFRNLLVLKFSRKPEEIVDALPNEIDLLKASAERISVSSLSEMLDLLIKEEPAIRFSVHPKITMEMAFIRLADLKPSLPIGMLIEKLDILREEIGRGLQFIDEPADSRLIAQEGEKCFSKDGGGAIESLEPAPESFGKELKESWEEIEKIVSNQYPLLGANLKKAEISFQEDRVLEIRVQGNGFTAAHINKHSETLKEICSQFTGSPVDMRVTVSDQEKASGEANMSEEKITKEEALNHPLISDAVEIFDAKVIGVQILQEVKHERHG
jgi:DNA polymerase-3 subunit gamma/tau